MRHVPRRALVAGALAACLAPQARAANPAAELEAPVVDVVGTTPLPGVGTPLSQVPANVQTVSDRRLEAVPAPGLPDFLERGMGGFVSATSQGNPFQNAFAVSTHRPCSARRRGCRCTSTGFG
jgi:outer membrane receptor protein involved in Fe transport